MHGVYMDGRLCMPGVSVEVRGQFCEDISKLKLPDLGPLDSLTCFLKICLLELERIAQ